MTAEDLEQWLIYEGAVNIVVVLDGTGIVRIVFDVGSNESARLLGALNELLYATAAAGVQYQVTCRNTYTGVISRALLPDLRAALNARARAAGR